MYLNKPVRRKNRYKFKKKRLVLGFNKKHPFNKVRMFKLRFQQNYIRRYRHKLLHSLFTRIMYKTFEGHQFFIAKERKYNDFFYDKAFFRRFKDRFLSFSKKLIYRFKLRKETKRQFFWNVQANFGFYPYPKYKLYSNLVEYYNNLFKNLEINKGTLHFTSNYISKMLVQQYRSMAFLEPTTYNNKVSFKWGRVTTPYYKESKYRRYKELFRHNYLYFNISVLRYIQVRNYINKLIKYLLNYSKYRSMTKKSYGAILGCIQYNLSFLTTNFNKLNYHIALNKLRLENYFKQKKRESINDRRMLFVSSRLRLHNIRQIYLSYIKNLLIRYFKINLHLKFTKSNIFITVTNYKGDVKYRYSIGLIGYKKDQKKTYYAAKELIKECIPKLFSVFKIKTYSILNSLTFIQTDILKMYVEMLSKNKEIESLWDYPSKMKLSFEEGFRKIILHTMQKFITLRIILRGSKSKLKGLMRRVFKELRNYRYKNKKHLVRILFLALNTKPHNGCRSPKKGRRRTKRRRQRLKFKLLDKQYEFQQKIRKKQLFWRRRFLRMYKMKIPKHISKSPMARTLVKSHRLTKKKRIVSNFQNNIIPAKKYYFMYAGPRRKKPTKPFIFKKHKLPRKYRMWRDHDRWSNPFAIQPMKITTRPTKLSRKPQFYKVS